MRMEMLVRGEQEVELIPQAAKEYVDGTNPTNECFFFAHKPSNKESYMAHEMRNPESLRKMTLAR